MPTPGPEMEKRPPDTPYKQQALPAWTPLLTPHWVISCFVFAAAVCIPIGALILVAADANKEVSIRYDEQFKDCHWSSGSQNGGDACLYTTDQSGCQGKCNQAEHCGMIANLDSRCPRDFSSPRSSSASKVDWTSTWQGNLTMLETIGIPNDRRFGSLCDPKCTEELTFTVEETLSAPVYMYYRLTSFHQNHRIYAMSRRDKQLAGETQEGDGDCAPANSPGGLATSDKDWCQANFGQDCGSVKVMKCDPWGSECAPKDPFSVSDLTYNACGVVAWSMFNDSFAIFNPDNTYLCDGDAFRISDSECIDNARCGNCTKKNIAYPGDIDKKYKPPVKDPRGFTYAGFKDDMRSCQVAGCDYWTMKEDASALPFLFHGWYFWEPYHQMPVTFDEDFMIWMRTSTLPTFRKLYRRIDVDIPPGKYRLKIDNRFDVSRFSGEKYVVLAQLNWIGGTNTVLGLLYIFAGMVCLGTACIFAVKHMTNKQA